MLKRSRAREVAFILIYGSFFSGYEFEDLIKLAKEDEFLKIDDFVKLLVTGVLLKREEIDSKIKKYLIGWKFERVSAILIAILEIAFYEILFVDCIDFPISINEAVELAKKYYGKDGHVFVNGVLGCFIKSIKK